MRFQGAQKLKTYTSNTARVAGPGRIYFVIAVRLLFSYNFQSINNADNPIFPTLHFLSTSRDADKIGFALSVTGEGAQR